MPLKLFRKFRSFDWFLIINILLLIFFGLSALYSLQFNTADPDFTLFKKQVIFVIIGLILFFLVSFVNHHFWGDYYKVIIIISFLVLLLVLSLGVTLGGARGWFKIGGTTIQPVELVKIALVIFLAKFFSIHAKDLKVLKYIIISAIVTGGLVGLVIIQPDFGSAMILLSIWILIVAVLPLKKKFYFKMFAIFIILLVISWSFVFQDYQRDRILTFMNPQNDPLGTGYNVTQSIIAVGSGQFIGRGLALGSQSQLNFLPAQETDFIFAVIAEELGFIGASILLVLFFTLFYRIFKILKKASDDYSIFLILGILTFLIAQLFINIGMNMGLAPIAGLPLPLVSYGGSSLISTLIALGIIHNIHLRNRDKYFN